MKPAVLCLIAGNRTANLNEKKRVAVYSVGPRLLERRVIPATQRFTA